ncbi:hypothetical protein [Streptomyces sp. MI02-7b]|uniref:hypothetical protein n=1 Tax=Streptomyces sp. MI02-7b TaxID=462941 RepID=UPI0029B520D5|nr:hypothetical protein [Streptomyces sp. MI02-7b]MDX3078397.1 hypothetical protein [Streptomyces sp. MI02-7b]
MAERHREVDGQQLYVGRFWGPPGAVGVQGVVSGPGFRALADQFPPGTRIELPEAAT